MYKSPIDILQTAWETELEGEILKASAAIGIYVDEGELRKALEYDRNQYDKGYSDAMEDMQKYLCGAAQSCSMVCEVE